MKEEEGKMTGERSCFLPIAMEVFALISAAYLTFTYSPLRLGNFFREKNTASSYVSSQESQPAMQSGYQQPTRTATQPIERAERR